MTTETFGQRLKRLREANGWTQNDLASISKINMQTIKEVEEAYYHCKCMTLAILADRLGVTMDYLYTGVEPVPTANTPGKRIRQRRDELGWRIDDLVNQVTKATNGHVGMSPCEVALSESDCIASYTSSIAKALGVTPEWILTGSEPKFPEKPKVPDAEWFVGWDCTKEVERLDGNDILTISVKLKPGYVEKVMELIRTGRAVE